MLESTKVRELSLFLNLSQEEIRQMDRSIQDLPGFAKWINVATDDWRQKKINQKHRSAVEDWFRDNDKYLFELCDVYSQAPKKKISKQILDICKKNNIKSILDYGGGIGEESIVASRASFKASMADLPSITFDFAKWRAEKLALPIKFIKIINNEPLTKIYDAITCFEVIQHLYDPEKVIRHIVRHLNSGGLLFITTRFNNPTYPMALKKNYKYDEGMTNFITRNGLILYDKIYQYGKGTKTKYLYVYKKISNNLSPLNVAFLGSRPISIKALELVDRYIKERGLSAINLSVYTKSDERPPHGVNKWWKLGKLKEIAKDMRFNLLNSSKQLISFKFDLITMVFFNEIIPKAIINEVLRGITNIHFGYLPSIDYSDERGSPHKRGQPFSIGTYRGSNVLTHAILNKEKWQAVTLHFITDKIDLGPIIEYAWNSIGNTTTAWDLQLESEKKGLEMFRKFFPLLIENPQSIRLLKAGKGKYPYYNRYSLDKIKVLDPKISESRLDLIARAFSFPNTEPPYFLEKDRKGHLLKRYVIYKKGKGVVVTKPRKTKLIQRLAMF